MHGIVDSMVMEAGRVGIYDITAAGDRFFKSAMDVDGSGIVC